MKKFLRSMFCGVAMLAAGFGFAACGDGSTIQFKGGTCEVSILDIDPIYAPADMKENEKAFMVRFLYKLSDEATGDALSVLYDDGEFVTPEGTAYKAGVAAINDSLYSLIVAVPKDLDVETLKFVYDKQTVSLKQK